MQNEVKLFLYSRAKGQLLDARAMAYRVTLAHDLLYRIKHRELLILLVFQPPYSWFKNKSSLWLKTAQIVNFLNLFFTSFVVVVIPLALLLPLLLLQPLH